jgi:Ni/Co efflux regulator RcnB
MHVKLKQAALLLSISPLVAGSAFGKQPDDRGNNNKQHSSHQQEESSSDHDDDNDSRSYFNDDHMQLIKRYYSESKHHGKNCPPGLKKKHNGCQPPGQEKKGHKGERLSRDIIYYDLPNALTVELGHIPEGQKIVRVGTDILLISIGTGMVLDALQDLDDIF